MKAGDEFCVIDVTRIWSVVSSYAIQEDIAKYLKVLDQRLKEIQKESVIYLTGKTPVWLYMTFAVFIVTTRPDIHLFYTKPTVHGNRPYKIYPINIT